MKKETPQFLESQLKMARPKRAEVKRVPLTVEEKEFLGKIMDKAVAAEKAGKLAEAIERYTEYKEELLKIKEKGKERKVEKIWQDLIDKFLESIKEVFILRFFAGLFEKQRDMQTDRDRRSIFEAKRSNIARQVIDIIADGPISPDKIGAELWEKYHANQALDSLNIFDISEEEKKKYFEMNVTVGKKIKLMSENFELKPEVKEEIAQILREDEGVQEYVEELINKAENK